MAASQLKPPTAASIIRVNDSATAVEVMLTQNTPVKLLTMPTYLS